MFTQREKKYIVVESDEKHLFLHLPKEIERKELFRRSRIFTQEVK